MSNSNNLHNQNSLNGFSRPAALPSIKELGLDAFIPDYTPNTSQDDRSSSSSPKFPTQTPTSLIPSVSKSPSKFSFISIFDKPQDPKPRRRYHQLDRPYNCIHENCTKKYSTLNHLNAHIRTQNHGRPRFKEEFPRKQTNTRSQTL
ncbi:hypothetical protein CONCODRAFT_77809 [Conidiobolus coronatus NRRL 28638]|uniref:C2H2-type domain-containing protein n=1 Tax=Conidiobolus coronatus (strain ATCC 28846 / CBS 209.66 / NRRL 28638) TaxID=796925 RepID=A0A137PBU8_CONC2|nr:hypothetical protein CONCODRAFT_77809 [Conidiobolus coronatus NRRL 28638]|eukprot:KXN72446.1 hypothetical protein CONCODRAFT_77809 [Conidiobolus coronatus NRRL 28638]